MSPWENISIGEKTPDVVNVVVEIPQGSQNKYEFDEKSGVFKLDRVLFTAFRYPLDYGFIPETRSEDGDHADALIIGTEPVPLGTVVPARPIAILNMIDSGEADAKILAVQDKNPRFDTIKDLKDIQALNPHLLREIEHFFGIYKELEGKETETRGWRSAEDARRVLVTASERFKKKVRSQ